MEKIRKFFKKEKFSKIRRIIIRDKAIRLLSKEKYVYQSLLGTGSFGDVISVRTPDNSSRFAAKILRSDVTSFVECALWPTFEHPNVISMIQMFTTSDVNIFMMPVCEKTMLSMAMDKKFYTDPMSFPRSKIWLINILDGLEYLHQNNVCHLDLRVGNVLITIEMAAIIFDFSTASLATERVTSYGLPRILRPPEACYSCGRSRAVDGKAFDIWSFGMIALSLWTDSWFRKGLDLKKSWKTGIYPILFTTLKKSKFVSTVTRTFPCTTGNEKKKAQRFIQGILTYYPERRPSISDIRRNVWIPDKARNEDLLERDIIWSEFHEEQDFDKYEHMNDYEEYIASDSTVSVLSEMGSFGFIYDPVVDEGTHNHIELNIKKIIKEASEHVKKLKLEQEKDNASEKNTIINVDEDDSVSNVVDERESCENVCHPAIDESTRNQLKLNMKRIIKEAFEHVKKLKLEEEKFNASEKDLDTGAKVYNVCTSDLLDVTGGGDVSQYVLDEGSLDQIQTNVQRIIHEAFERVQNMKLEKHTNTEKDLDTDPKVYDECTSDLLDVTGGDDVSHYVIDEGSLDQIQMNVQRIIHVAFERVQNMKLEQHRNIEKGAFKSAEGVQISAKRPPVRKSAKVWFLSQISRICCQYNCLKQKSSRKL